MLAYKRLEEHSFIWPGIKDGPMTLSHAQFETLFAGLDADLPDDVVALKAMLIAAQAREAGEDAQIAPKDERIERLEKLVAAFKRAAFRRKPDKTYPDQSTWLCGP